jgi:anti-anti-sigma factor
VEYPLSSRLMSSCVLVELPEEIDMLNAAAIERQLLDLLAPEVEGLIIHMARTSFCGSHGIAAIISAHERAARTSKWVCLVGLRDEIRRTFAMVGIDQVLSIRDSVDEALAQHDGVPRAGPMRWEPEGQGAAPPHHSAG